MWVEDNNYCFKKVPLRDFLESIPYSFSTYKDLTTEDCSTAFGCFPFNKVEHIPNEWHRFKKEVEKFASTKKECRNGNN